MDMKGIQTETEYKDVLQEIEHIFDAMPGTLEGGRLETLVTLVEKYEDEHYPI